MIKKRIKELTNKFVKYKIDGYVIPKNDEYFSEYSKNDRLKTISNFTGSAGCSVILKKKYYLFVDGRYTIQAQNESGSIFKIISYEKIFNCNLFKNLTLGLDPKIFSSQQIENFFKKYNKIKLIDDNLIDQIYKNKSKSQKSFYSISKKVVGENYEKKLEKIKKYLKKTNADFILITASENVAWLLNIRGFDNPNSPVPNCHLLIDKNNSLYLISERNKVKKLINEKKIKKNQVFEPKKFEKLVMGLKGNRIIVDFKTCSLFYENILKRKFKILKKEDPIYLLKSIKNNQEIQNMLSSHIIDGAALTKFLYWIKVKNKKKITEFDAQKKLQFFRKKNKKYAK